MRIENTTIFTLFDLVMDGTCGILNETKVSKDQAIRNLSHLFEREKILEKDNLLEADRKKTLVPLIIIGCLSNGKYWIKDYNGYLQSIFFALNSELKLNLNPELNHLPYFAIGKHTSADYIDISEILTPSLPENLVGNKNILRFARMYFRTRFPVLKTYPEEKELLQLKNEK